MFPLSLFGLVMSRKWWISKSVKPPSRAAILTCYTAKASFCCVKMGFYCGLPRSRYPLTPTVINHKQGGSGGELS